MISVIIPSYNRCRTITMAVQSVLNQTINDLELIVVDDGSTDETKEILGAIEDSRLRYIYQDNAGACSARNNGIEEARGEYIAFHDSDDIWHQNKLEEQLNALRNNNADIVICQNQYKINGEFHVTPKLNESGFLTPKDMPYGIGTQTFFMKAHIAKDIRFDLEMPRFQDLEWLLRATRKYKLYAMAVPLVDYTISDDAITRSSKKMYKATELILKKHQDVAIVFPLIGEFFSSILISYGVEQYQNKNHIYRKTICKGCKLSNRKQYKLLYYLVIFNLFPIAYFFRKKVFKH